MIVYLYANEYKQQNKTIFNNPINLLLFCFIFYYYYLNVLLFI